LSLSGCAGTLAREAGMSDTRVPRNVFLAIVAAGILQCLHDFPLLPERMASHFGASGHANGWMMKSQFLSVYVVVIIPAVILEFWIPRKIGRTRDNRLNLPNKDHWLAPERRAETVAYFETFFAWYGCVFLVLEVFAMGLCMRANFHNPPQLPTGPIVFAITAFVLFNAASIIVVFRRFSKLPHV
jgi:uncharacterized membrane protein